jgi:Flp pilus assembly protein TadB
MKNAYALSIFIILSLCLTPFQTTQAALVPVEKTNSPTKKLKKKVLRQNIKKAKLQLRKHKKKHQKRSYKQQQEDNYSSIGAWVILILSIYFITAITLTIVGFVFALPGLWVTGIILLAIPIILFLIGIIQGTINSRKQAKERKRKENEGKESEI